MYSRVEELVRVQTSSLLMGKSSPCSGCSGFRSRYLNCLVPYVRRYITVNKMC